MLCDGFNNCLHQVKASFPDLDLSQISINDVAQTLVRSVDPKGTDKLFTNDPTPDAQGDREATLQDEHVKSVEDEKCPREETKTVNYEKVVDEEALVDQP